MWEAIAGCCSHATAVSIALSNSKGLGKWGSPTQLLSLPLHEPIWDDLPTNPPEAEQAEYPPGAEQAKQVLPPRTLMHRQCHQLLLIILFNFLSVCLLPFQLSISSHLLLQLLFRLWTVSHSSEHIEGLPTISSRLNPSQFTASPNASPSRNLPHDHVYAQAAPLQEPTPVGEPIPNIAGYSQEGSDHPQRHGDNPHSTWNGQQSPESPFVDRTSSFGGWVDTSQHQGSPSSGQGFAQSGQGLSRLGQNQSPNHQLELDPEAPEHFSLEHNYSDTPRLSGHMAPHGSGVYSSHLQPQTDQQTNGNATDWQHHANMTKTFQHI